jgi:hypothetical protein
LTESNAVTKFEQVAARYIALLSEPDADARSRAVAEMCTEDGAYTDPLAWVQGHQATEEAVSGAREQFPGHVFKPIGNVDAPHDVARFGWEPMPKGGDE